MHQITYQLFTLRVKYFSSGIFTLLYIFEGYLPLPQNTREFSDYHIHLPTVVCVISCLKSGTIRYYLMVSNVSILDGVGMDIFNISNIESFNHLSSNDLIIPLTTRGLPLSYICFQMKYKIIITFISYSLRVYFIKLLGKLIKHNCNERQSFV